jgi:hypothetical protein
LVVRLVAQPGRLPPALDVVGPEVMTTDALTGTLRGWLGLPPRPLLPAPEADRWHARLFFLRPLLRWSLGGLWMITGLLSFGLYPVAESHRLLAMMAMEDSPMEASTLKLMHILSAILLFGTGLGTAFHGLASNLSQDRYHACGDYANLLAAHRIRPSMSRVGNPYDNAKAERFMQTLKQEEVDAAPTATPSRPGKRSALLSIRFIIDNVSTRLSAIPVPEFLVSPMGCSSRLSL